MKTLLVILSGLAGILCIIEACLAGDFKTVDIREVKITYRSFFSGGTDPLITQNQNLPGHQLGKELNLGVNIDLLQYAYWNNTVHSMTDEVPGGTGQFRAIGWEFGLGLDLARVHSSIPITVGYYHYSQHLLDTEHSLGHFPVRDAIELNLYIYRK